MIEKIISKRIKDFIPLQIFFTWREIKTKIRIGIKTSLPILLKMWKKGFFEESYYLFCLDENKK